MSWQAMAAIDQLPADAVRDVAFRVLLKLANVAAEDGTRAYRYIGAMASELGRSQRTIKRALKELEASAILLPGNQRAVAHIQGQKPTVYDINMRLCVEWVEQSVPLFEEVTPLSTGSEEVTQEVTAGVPHRELRELPTKSYSRNQTADVTSSPCGHEMIDDRHCVFGCPIRAEAHA